MWTVLCNFHYFYPYILNLYKDFKQNQRIILFTDFHLSPKLIDITIFYGTSDFNPDKVTFGLFLVTFKLFCAGFYRTYYNCTKGNYPQWLMLQILENNQLLWKNVYLMGIQFVPCPFLVSIALFVMVCALVINDDIYLIPLKVNLSSLKLFCWWCLNVVLYYEFWWSALFPAGNIVHCSWNPNLRLIQDW